MAASPASPRMEPLPPPVLQYRRLGRFASEVRGGRSPSLHQVRCAERAAADAKTRLGDEALLREDNLVEALGVLRLQVDLEMRCRSPLLAEHEEREFVIRNTSSPRQFPMEIDACTASQGRAS
eukprot:CAMPEP_0170648256 /NCGR_PEP_ID=MMETSP0224-20130122/44645_1 /TAXON_ID=285029 /ORGANISM="Togula jolla, Strain CCCM 725" /LENGTH=122 /DNA_ID=CAMNT_0010979785 /DNA_START=159 /DNA_END=528 /DNA_ORIENTATION=+